MKATGLQQLHQRRLDVYPVTKQPTKRNDVIPVRVTIVNVNLSTEPTHHMLDCKVEVLVGVIRYSQNREGYALQGRVRDTLFMMGVIRDDDEFERLLRITHSTGRIREHGTINGAWVTNG